jgi:hypothetical protein
MAEPEIVVPERRGPGRPKGGKSEIVEVWFAPALSADVISAAAQAAAALGSPTPESEPTPARRKPGAKKGSKLAPRVPSPPPAPPPPSPAELAALLVRQHAADILNAAGDGFVVIDSDGFLDTLDADEFIDRIGLDAGCDFTHGAVRLAVLLDGHVLLARYASAEDFPEAPTHHTWLTRQRPEIEHLSTLAETFPSLRFAPGVRPWQPEALATFAYLAGGQALCAAALVLEMQGLHYYHRAAWSPVAVLFESLPGGLSWAMREVFDAEHRAAVVAWRGSWVRPPPVPVAVAPVPVPVVEDWLAPEPEPRVKRTPAIRYPPVACAA